MQCVGLKRSAVDSGLVDLGLGRYTVGFGVGTGISGLRFLRLGRTIYRLAVSVWASPE